MKRAQFDDIQVGDDLPSVVEGPITRHALGVYADASGDDNPLHLDTDFARRAGMPDVFAHGMLSAAYLARVLTQSVKQSAIRRMSVRFVAITHLGDEVRCQARVSEKFIQDGEPCVALELTARNQSDEIKLIGSAVVALV
ncbi:MaoC/PaaZ C-terminal domain-containing protein [Rhodoferax sp.]|uniref:MaoC/PaaZ C-terminal domain-containing protein n=1 Tax=Rhodoferax sp. TaxID=50421 RepID=UPI00260B01FE|nr:MaoC/PaaZ C-terminal domain-containing protein [Rhodoferax sp.]MDD3937861.1 MaoC/PaaZ C-terminal domain-containing protein [Rhodoferax sp.]